MLSYLPVIISSTGTVIIAVLSALSPLWTAKATQKLKIRELNHSAYQNNFVAIYKELCESYGQYYESQSAESISRFVSAISQCYPIIEYDYHLTDLLRAVTHNEFNKVIALFPETVRSISNVLKDEKSKINKVR